MRLNLSNQIPPRGPSTDSATDPPDPFSFVAPNDRSFIIIDNNEWIVATQSNVAAWNVSQLDESPLGDYTFTVHTPNFHRRNWHYSCHVQCMRLSMDIAASNYWNRSAFSGPVPSILCIQLVYACLEIQFELGTRHPHP